MWIRKQIEIGWADLFFGLRAAFFDGTNSGNAALSAIEEVWPGQKPVVFLSVRSGFDCLLQSVQWQPRAEVIMSGLTIPDMPRIVEGNGFQVVPVDINESTMAPDVDAIAQAITPDTRAIVVAHLFGNRILMEPYAELARAHDLLLIEDCAQNFVDGYSGSSSADVSMFSFGPIKAATALGGGVFQIRNPDLRQFVAEKHATYPVQSDIKHGQRVLKYLGIKAASHPTMAGLVFSTIRLIGYDPDEVVAKMAKGFAGDYFFERIRQQPASSLLRLLGRRLENSDLEKLDWRVEQANYLAEKLTPPMKLLGQNRTSESGVGSTYWVTPVCASNPEMAQRLVAKLSNQNFDATQRSSLAVVQRTGAETDGEKGASPPNGNLSDANLPNATSILDRIVFLPICDGMELSDLSRMAEIANQVCCGSDEGLTESQLGFE